MQLLHSGNQVLSFTLPAGRAQQARSIVLLHNKEHSTHIQWCPSGCKDNSRASNAKICYARNVKARATGLASPPSESSSQSPSQLVQLEIHPFINAQGLVMPPAFTLPDGNTSAGYVFAVFDSHQKLQYVGFSQDLRNSLRTLLGRRPDKAHYYKAQGVAALDQKVMMSIRDAWFEQAGGAPAGNKLALERALWQQPVDAFAISDRGKKAAAEDKVRQTLEALTIRGLKEEFIANPALLENGQVDFMPSADMSAEARAALLAAQQAAAAATRSVHTIIDGQDRSFHVRTTYSQATSKGGYMLDVKVTLDNRETLHRIIVGSQYVSGAGLQGPEPAVEAAMSTLLSTKQVRHTDGVMPVGQFPVNYFTVSEVEQWFGQEFRDAFKIATGKELEQRAAVAWRFTRLHSYTSGLLDDQDWQVTHKLGSQDSSLGRRTSDFVFE